MFHMHQLNPGERLKIPNDFPGPATVLVMSQQEYADFLALLTKHGIFAKFSTTT